MSGQSITTNSAITIHATWSGHMRHWSAMARPPKSALKEIKGGRLRGMTDVNPQWRYQAMTEEFGPVGVGWKYDIERLWTEPGCDGEVLGFAHVSVRVKTDGTWSDPVPGIGGNHLITKESGGLRNNDECWKMAITDALSVALKMLGVAADIYAGLWDGSKYVAEGMKAEKAAPAPVVQVKRIALPAGTVQIVSSRIGDWGGSEIVVVDADGVETTHKTTERQLGELCEQLAQDAVPVVLDLQKITRGKNAGKDKLVAVHRFSIAENNALDAEVLKADENVGHL